MGPEANITTTVLHLAIPSVIEKHKQNQTNKQTNKKRDCWAKTGGSDWKKNTVYLTLSELLSYHTT